MFGCFYYILMFVAWQLAMTMVLRSKKSETILKIWEWKIFSTFLREKRRSTKFSALLVQNTQKNFFQALLLHKWDYQSNQTIGMKFQKNFGQNSGVKRMPFQNGWFPVSCEFIAIFGNSEEVWFARLDVTIDVTKILSAVG